MGSFRIDGFVNAKRGSGSRSNKARRKPASPDFPNLPYLCMATFRRFCQKHPERQRMSIEPEANNFVFLAGDAFSQAEEFRRQILRGVC
jgi:hypothetical protein